MQRQYTEADIFYLEYSEVDKNKYNFHLSFKSKEKAADFFDRAKYVWKLPVDIDGNRVIVFEGEGTVDHDQRYYSEACTGTKNGVFYCWKGTRPSDEMVGIHFSCEEHAIEFWEYQLYCLRNDVKDREIIKYESGYYKFNNYHFEKDKIIHPDYSLKKRVNQLQLMDKLLAISKAANAHGVPYEVIKYMVAMNIIVDNRRPSERYQLLNKKFLLDTQRVPVSGYAPIDCQTEYAGHKSRYKNFGKDGWGGKTYFWDSMSLYCANTYDAKMLCSRLKESTILNVELSANKVTILPHDKAGFADSNRGYLPYDLHVGDSEYDIYCYANISFKNACQAQNFADLITIEGRVLEPKKSTMEYYVACDKFEKIYRLGQHRKHLDKFSFFAIHKDIPGQIKLITDHLFPDIDKLILRMDDSKAKTLVLEMRFDQNQMSMRKSLRENCISCLSNLKICIGEGLQERSTLDQILNVWRQANAESLDMIHTCASEKEGKWIEDVVTQIQQKNDELYLFMTDEALWRLRTQ